MRPVEMDVQMHMVGAMVAPHDWITFAMMVPYVIKDLDGPQLEGEWMIIAGLQMSF